MLTALSFGNIYQTDGNYITLIVMNFVIAVAMLGTPMIVRSLVGQGIAGMAPALGAAAVATMAAAPTKFAMTVSKGREVLNHTGGFAAQKFTTIKNRINPQRRSE